MKPWEKYGATSKATGPWSKYSTETIQAPRQLKTPMASSEQATLSPFVQKMRNMAQSPFMKSLRTEPSDAKAPEAFSATGQIAGGIAGGTMLAPYMGPYRGGAVGGTGGRMLGGQMGRQAQQFRQKPVRTLFDMLKDPVGYPIRDVASRSPQERGRLGAEAGITAGVETATGGLAKGAIGLGRGVMKGVVGQKAAEFGQKYGWKPIVELADRISKAVPTPVKMKMGNFFRNLSNKVGGELDNLIATKYRDVVHSTAGLRAKIVSYFPKGKNVADLDASKIQRTRIQNFMGNFYKKSKMSLHEIWQTRRELDKVLYGQNWSDEAYEFLTSMRRALNEPIKQYDDVGKLFTKYAGVKESEKTLGKYMRVHKGLTKGEVFSPEIESFGRKIMGVTGDEMIAWLQALDKELGPQYKVMDNFLKFAASQALEGDVGWSYITKILLGSLGGKRLFPHIGRAIQSPAVQVPAKALGRLTPVGLTELLNRSQ